MTARDQDAYLEKVKKFIATAKTSGGTARVWRSSLAGNETGLIFIATEYANLDALAKGMAKVEADEELSTSGIREVVSNSLFEEVTP